MRTRSVWNVLMGTALVGALATPAAAQATTDQAQVATDQAQATTDQAAPAAKQTPAPAPAKAASGGGDQRGDIAGGYRFFKVEENSAICVNTGLPCPKTTDKKGWDLSASYRLPSSVISLVAETGVNSDGIAADKITLIQGGARFSNHSGPVRVFGQLLGGGAKTSNGWSSAISPGGGVEVGAGMIGVRGTFDYPFYLLFGTHQNGPRIGVDLVLRILKK